MAVARARDLAAAMGDALMTALTAWINIYTLKSSPAQPYAIAHKTKELAENNKNVRNDDFVYRCTREVAWRNYDAEFQEFLRLKDDLQERREQE